MTTARIVNIEPGLLQSLQARQQFQEAAQAQLADARANGARLSWEMGGRVFTLGDVVIGAGAFFAARAFGLKGLVPAFAAARPFRPRKSVSLAPRVPMSPPLFGTFRQP